MKPMTDEKLVLAIQQGDISAYEQLVHRYQQALYFFIVRILREESASRDIVQDALVKVYQIIDTIDSKKKFSTFLFEIAKNAAFSHLRKKKKYVSLEAIGDIQDEESFIENYLRRDQYERVRAVVQSLEQKYKMVLSMYYFEDLSYEEISKATHIPINTVRTHLKRAKDAFKKKYSP